MVRAARRPGGREQGSAAHGRAEHCVSLGIPIWWDGRITRPTPPFLLPLQWNCSEYTRPLGGRQSHAVCTNIGPYTRGVVGSLFVVATPIGNLDDLTLRAARVLGEVDLIAAENTKTASKLLRHLQVSTTTLPYNDRNKARATGRIIAALKADQDVALTTDAGTPGLSDPGQDLVRDAVAAGATVVPVPGASAVTALLSVAGVRTRTAHFIGFLPRKAGERQRRLESIAEHGEPALAFESPRRIMSSLAAIATVMPDAHLVVGREMTKLHEEIWRGAPADAVAHFENPRGEFALLIVPPEPQPERWSDDAVRAALRLEQEAGRRRPAASATVASRSSRPRREVYALWPDR